VESLTNRAARLLKHCGVELIVLDEFHHLFDVDRAKVMTKASQWLKVLIVNTGLPVVVCGMPEAEYVLSAEHTERRFKQRLTLRCFTWRTPQGQREVCGMLKKLDETLPLAESSALANADMAGRLWSAATCRRFGFLSGFPSGTSAIEGPPTSEKESGDKSPHSQGRRPGLVTTPLASVGRCSQPETDSRRVAFVATTVLVSVERCLQFSLARRVGWPRSPVWEHHPTRTSRVVVDGGLGEGTRSGVEHGSTQTSCVVAAAALGYEGPHRLRALIVDAGKVQANVNVLRPGPVLDILAVLLRQPPEMLPSMTVHRLAPTLVLSGEPSPTAALCDSKTTLKHFARGQFPVCPPA